jgi:hypothetical protein
MFPALESPCKLFSLLFLLMPIDCQKAIENINKKKQQANKEREHGHEGQVSTKANRTYPP